MLGASLNLPIFSSGMRNSKIQQAKIELEKSKNIKELVSRNLKVSVLLAKSTLTTANEKYANNKDNLKLAERIYNDFLLKFKEGTASSIELTQAQNQYLTTQGNYISAMVEMLNAKNALDKAMGNY